MGEAGDGGGAASPRRLRVYSLGFARQPRVRRILDLAGWRVAAGWPRGDDAVGVWGRKPVSARGRRVARWSGAGLVTVEDGFLRSVRPGVAGDEPLSLLIDDLGVHYDPAAPSRLERLILEGVPEAARARAGIARLRELGLSKYNTCFGPPPEPGHVLVIDQTRGDASVTASGAGVETFRAMLAAARAENPGARIVVRTHPDVALGRRAGHLGAGDLRPGEVIDTDASPWRLVEGAAAVYAVSSQLGYEALLAGRPVRLFGRPFYAGWGLTEDEAQVPRRAPRPVEALFTASHLVGPVHYDPWADRLCTFERAVEVLNLLARAHREAARPAIATGMRLWKRRHVAPFLDGAGGPPRFVEPPEQALDEAARTGRDLVIWAGRETPALREAAEREGVALSRMEDGFLRSVGLGAELLPAASLVRDRTGIYYDPARESDLERLIAGPPPPAPELARAARLRAAIVAAGVTKYNTGAAPALSLPEGRRVILVPGQVEDDASILNGTGTVRTNLALLEAARKANPGAFLIYKPHPDVEAGLRDGALPGEAARQLADVVAAKADPAALIAVASQVWTMTSLMGFEALIRGRRAVCFGMPFYAGWGLTEDREVACPRRSARPSLDHLFWAALIAYPRYRDPVTGLACPPEVIVGRLAGGVSRAPSAAGRLLAKAQGLLAGWRGLWQ